LDRAIDWLLVERSRGRAFASGVGAVTGADGTVPIVISSKPNRGNQSPETFAESSFGNMGDVSKLSRYGESLMSGDVKLVKAVEAGAGVKGSWKISRGDTVRADPGVMVIGLMEVNADAVKSKFSTA